MCPLSILPVEVLQQICAQLCSHCTEIRPSDDNIHAHALGALCLTSSLVRSVAQPILFHHLKGGRLYSMVQTLKEHSDLADNTKKYTQASLFNPHFMESTDEPEFSFMRRLARQLLLGGAPDEHSEALSDAPWNEELLVQIVLSIAPNMETVELHVSNSLNEISRFEDLSARFKCLDGAGLPNLRHVQFTTDWRWGFCLDSPAIGVILHAAPNLRQLIFKHCIAWWGDTIAQDVSAIIDQYPELPNVRSLEFQNCGFEDRENSLILLTQLAERCPQLEHFRLHSDEAYISDYLSSTLTAPGILKSLISHRKQLKYLDINLVESALRRSLDSTTVVADLHLLGQFTNIETLKLGDDSFCLHRQNPRLASNTCLSKILPQSVKTLVVRVIFDSHAWEDLAELAVQVKAGRFPNLESINIYAISGIMRGTWGMRMKPKFREQIRENSDQLHELYAKTQVCLFVAEQEEASNEGEDSVLGVL